MSCDLRHRVQANAFLGRLFVDVCVKLDGPESKLHPTPQHNSDHHRIAPFKSCGSCSMWRSQLPCHQTIAVMEHQHSLLQAHYRACGCCKGWRSRTEVGKQRAFQARNQPAPCSEERTRALSVPAEYIMRSRSAPFALGPRQCPGYDGYDFID